MRIYIDDKNNIAEIHSESYPEDFIGIRRKSTNEEFGCVVCVSTDGFIESDYEEYEIATEQTEEIVDNV